MGEAVSHGRLSFTLDLVSSFEDHLEYEKQNVLAKRLVTPFEVSWRRSTDMRATAMRG